MVPQRMNAADSQQQQQQWMGMQYTSETRVMRHPYYHQMIPFQPQRFFLHPSILYHQQQSPQGSPQENRTIWVGHLHYWMEENYLHSCFAHTGQVASVKVIRNKQTGQSEGYGFIKFCTREAAEEVLQTYNGSAMPYAEQAFSLNWAAFGIGDRHCSDRSIFVGNLASDVTDILLQGTFASKYPSISGAKVVIDANTGRSKGYGFVRFCDAKERTRAITEMDGVYCSSRPMRVANPRKSNRFQQTSSPVYRHEKSYINNLPSDITLDILSRVPTESVLKCKLVCTTWRSIISNHPLFRKMHSIHLNQHGTNSSELGFVALIGDDSIYYFEYDENHESTKPIKRITRINFNLPYEFRVVGSCNGLICLAKRASIRIFNPIMREYVFLPDIDINPWFSYGGSSFGYVSSTNEYKVVGIFLRITGLEEVHIYTLGSGNGWRRLGNLNFQSSACVWNEPGTFSNGALYWLDEKSQMIITFDLAEEKFCQQISLPPLSQGSDWYDSRMGVVNGFLFLSIGLGDQGNGFNEIWLSKKKNHNHDMEEGDEYQLLGWSKEFSVIGNLLALNKSGGALTYGDHYLNIYNTKTTTLRRLVEFENCIFRVYPHKNTLVSLREIVAEDTKK